ncbi:SDR family oxidoreductase [Georgenia deserti]|uniref:SDR family oxidoreductase n=1 Tax=Georgenia deserti TaxID=2093781 RepID=A0ABW4KYS9_9MICO
MTTLPLSGRTALVTGAGRRAGIGFAVATRIAEMGADLVLHHHGPHDDDQPWGRDDLAAVRAALSEHMAEGARLRDVAADLADPDEPGRVVAEAAALTGHLDILVCNQARSGGDGALAEIGVDQLDAHWQVNARATLLLTQAFADRHDGREGGRVVWMTSGQQLGPLRGEVAYAASKAALAGLTATVADELIDQGIILNTVNPGPVDTGFLGRGVWLPDEVLDDVESRFPTGRVGRPDDPARLIAWLVSDEGRWVVGQVLNTEGGFRRS